MTKNARSLFVTLVFAVISTQFLCEAIVCYKCDSLSWPACATSLNETDLPIEDCSTSSLNCGMSIVDSVTYRGCSNSVPTIGATYRKTCPDNLCNKGVYPPGRLKCYQCNGDNCQDQPIGKPHPCLNHHEVDECFIDVTISNEVYRGCRSDLNYTVPEDAIFCDYNGCNNSPSVYKLQCATCDSALGKGCKRDLTAKNITLYDKCEMDVYLEQDKGCFTYHSINRVIRGCSDNIPQDVKEDMDNVLKCSGPDYCNTVNLEMQQCLECNSEKSNDNCRFNVTAIAKSYCGSPEASSCYAVEYNNWHIERGCAIAPSRDDINRKYECDYSGDCNITPFTRCYKCSTEADPNCAAWQRPGFLEIEECQNPNAKCLTAVYETGITMRGCESATLNCNDTTICAECEGSFCNRGSFPRTSLHCYQCGIGTEDDCAAAISKDPLPCPQTDLEYIGYNQKQACFEYFNAKKNRVVKGCSTHHIEDFYQCMLQNSQKQRCPLCHTDGCNDQLQPVEDKELQAITADKIAA